MARKGATGALALCGVAVGARLWHEPVVGFVAGLGPDDKEPAI